MRAAWLLVLVACGADRTVAPIIDVPRDDDDATASGLDDIIMTVAHAGNARDLVSQAFSRGAEIEMSGIPYGDDLVIHMTGFVGSSEVAYGRSCAFAVSPNTAPTPHMFFSRTVKFANAQVLNADDEEIAPQSRQGGVGMAYLGGALLLAGSQPGIAPNGSPAQVPVLTAERYDPSTNRLLSFGPLIARSDGAQALLGDGSKVVVLGGTAPDRGAQIMEVIDGLTVDQIAFSGTPRANLTATTLTDGQVLVAGGLANNLRSDELDEIDPSDSSVLVRKLEAKLQFPRSHHTATRLGDELGAPVLIAGGIGDSGKPIKTAELFNPLSSALSTPTHPDMLTERWGHIATRLPDGSVLFIGGVDSLGQAVFSLERFTRDTGFVDVTNSLPPDAGVIDAAAVTLPDGRILLTGGRSALDGSPVNTAYIIRFDPVDGMIDVISTDHLAIARAGHQMAVLCDGTVWVSGGSSVTVERYNPPSPGRR